MGRVLKKTGTFWLAIGDDYAAELKVLFHDQLGFHSRGWVIWYYTFGVNCTRKFSRSHTHLFHFVKDPAQFTFNGDAIRVPSARQLVYADSRANSSGRLPDDTWILRPQDVPRSFDPIEDTWYLPRVCGTFKERAGFHGCQMPERLLERIIKVSSNPGELVMDPFAGSGSTLVVAKKLCRNCIVFELSKNYAARIERRLDETYEGQPLEGAAEPKLSAPPTDRGKKLGPALPTASERHILTKTDAARGIIEAFIIARNGFPVDRVIADPDLNNEFIAACRRFGVPGAPVMWNRKLMNLRKSSQLSGLPRAKRTTFSEKETDRYSFACEIAIQSFHEKGHTLDYLLCDPALAKEFDALVRQIANQNLPSLLMRWIALSIRKRATHVRKVRSVAVDPVRLPARKETVASIQYDSIPEHAGLYWLRDLETDKKLYVGETINLRDRLTGQLNNSEFDFWGTPRGSLELRMCQVVGEEKRRATLLSGNQSIWIGKWRPVGIRAFEGHQGPVLACAFSADGARVLSGSDDNTLKLWDAASGRELTSCNIGWAVHGVVFHPNQPNLAIAALANGTLALVDLLAHCLPAE